MKNKIYNSKYESHLYQKRNEIFIGYITEEEFARCFYKTKRICMNHSINSFHGIRYPFFCEIKEYLNDSKEFCKNNNIETKYYNNIICKIGLQIADMICKNWEIKNNENISTN